ncbi:hypothetical protein D5086_003989 [Populus alba]|uniref:Uncharacterized protein n=1 Tax=Populus alba TaxID=43335 RepID=A0ACC4D8T0_POPAL
MAIGQLVDERSQGSNPTIGQVLWNAEINILGRGSSDFLYQKVASSPSTGFNSRISIVLGSKNGMDAKGCSSCSIALIFKERHQNKSGKKETCVSRGAGRAVGYWICGARTTVKDE